MIDSVVNRRPRHAVRDGDLGLVSAVATATASAVRNRVVVRIPAGTWATCSVKCLQRTDSRPAPPTPR
jgi:hypothetical protein